MIVGTERVFARSGWVPTGEERCCSAAENPVTPTWDGKVVAPGCACEGLGKKTTPMVKLRPKSPKTISGTILKGPIIPFGSLVEYHPISPKDQSRFNQFGKEVLPGIFLG